MKIYLVIASINELEYLNYNNLKNIDKIVVIDEGDEDIRLRNTNRLQNLDVEFYGPHEREKWFKERFGTNYEKYFSVIPKRCHAETSFGFLAAWEENVDVIIELDDDVKPLKNYPLVDFHLKNLYQDHGVTVHSRGRWYNTIENLKLNYAQRLFPRGHPYSPETRLEKYVWTNEGGRCVLNMGLWFGHPDLDALTILYFSGLNGKCHIEGIGLKREKVIVGKGTYFAVCSMNASFRRNIIPAFYQLYMKHFGIDRFDDIWSGIFLKKIADHLDDRISLGNPVVYHDKRPRSIFKDLRAELEGMIINEVLWRVVDNIELDGKDYHECYLELADGIKKQLEQFREKTHRDFIRLQVEKMTLWLNIVEKIL